MTPLEVMGEHLWNTIQYLHKRGVNPFPVFREIRDLEAQIDAEQQKAMEGDFSALEEFKRLVNLWAKLAIERNKRKEEPTEINEEIVAVNEEVLEAKVAVKQEGFNPFAQLKKQNTKEKEQ